jgi:small subunit ribosomal protein S20
MKPLILENSRLQKLAGLVTEDETQDKLDDLSKAFQAIDKAAKRGVIKKNTASRKKSRLAKAMAK